MDIYFKSIPEELYYNILEYCNINELLLLNKIKKIKYKKLFAYVYPKLFYVVRVAKEHDVELGIYPYKYLYFRLFKFSFERYKYYLEFINIDKKCSNVGRYITLMDRNDFDQFREIICTYNIITNYSMEWYLFRKANININTGTLTHALLSSCNEDYLNDLNDWLHSKYDHKSFADVLGLDADERNYLFIRLFIYYLKRFDEISPDIRKSKCYDLYQMKDILWDDSKEPYYSIIMYLKSIKKDFKIKLK